MKLKTDVIAEDGKQELLITRAFDLPVETLFKAFHDRELFEKWMGTDLLQFECKQFGGYHFQTHGPKGDVVFSGKGTFHEVVPNKRIVRTFEMDIFSLPPQLEFLDFKMLTSKKSELTMHIIFKSIEDRNELLKRPFALGLDMALNRLQEISIKIKY